MPPFRRALRGVETAPRAPVGTTQRAAVRGRRFPTKKIDMSTNDQSGAPAEAAATPPADALSAPASTFGTSRGSGLARGKRSSAASAAAVSPAKSDYKPTAIEIVNAPREYTNPFAPATPEPAPQAEVAPDAAPTAEVVSAPAPTPVESAPAAVSQPAAPSTPEEKAELNILPPETPKSAAPQTWESDGFRAPREQRGDRPRREGRYEGDRRERREGGEQRQPRPEGQPREQMRHERPEFRREDRAPRAEAPIQAAAPKPTGFFAKLKAFFTGGDAAPEAKPTEQHSHGGENRGEQRGGHRHHRGGRGGHRHHRGGDRPQSQAGEQGQGGEGHSHGGGEYRGEGRGDQRGGGGFRRRGGRGGRGRGGDRGFRGDRGGDRGGAPSGGDAPQS